MTERDDRVDEQPVSVPDENELSIQQTYESREGSQEAGETVEQRPKKEPAQTKPDKPVGRDEVRADDEIVDEDIDESFPASDPPSYTGSTAGG